MNDGDGLLPAPAAAAANGRSRTIVEPQNEPLTSSAAARTAAAAAIRVTRSSSKNKGGKKSGATTRGPNKASSSRGQEATDSSATERSTATAAKKRSSSAANKDTDAYNEFSTSAAKSKKSKKDGSKTSSGRRTTAARTTTAGTSVSKPGAAKERSASGGGKEDIMATMTFAHGGCANDNCSDAGCGDRDPSDSLHPVGTEVELLVEDDELVLGKIIFHPCAAVEDGNNYLVLTEEGGVYIVSVDDIDEYISDDNGGGNDGTPLLGLGTTIERNWEERGYDDAFFARIAAVPCSGGCGGMCEENPSGAKCGGRSDYEVEYFDDGFIERITPAAIEECVVGEPQGSYRMPPRPATLDVVALSLRAAGHSVDDPLRDGSGSGSGDNNVPSVQYSATTIATIEDALGNATIKRVDPSKIDDCHVGTCACGATAQTKLKVKNKGPSQHPDTTCWECARASNHPISDWVQNSAACLCCADRYRTFQNCRECVEGQRFCRSCEKLGCSGVNRYCQDCISSGKRGAELKCKSCEKVGCYGLGRYCQDCISSGKRGAELKCKNFSECKSVGTYQNSLFCLKCKIARDAAKRGASEVCVRCLIPKTSPGYVSGAKGSNVCAGCKGKCKAWIEKGKLCPQPGGKRGAGFAPLCNKHRHQCFSVGSKRTSMKYIVAGPDTRTDWPCRRTI